MYYLNINNQYFFSTHGFTDEVGNYYEPRLKTPALLRVSMMENFYSGQSVSDYGDISLINTDGSLYYLKNELLEGKKIWLIDDYSNVIESIITGVTFQSSTMNISIKDQSSILQNKYNTLSYLGNNNKPNGLEGDSNIAGNSKLKILGKLANVSAILVNSSKLIYHCGGRPEIVRDKGAELLFESFVDDIENYQPLAGKWVSSGEYIRLGSSPIGTVTVDCNNSVKYSGDVLSLVLNNYGFSLSDSDRVSINSHIIGIDATDLTGFEIIDKICKSCFVNWYVDGNVLKICQISELLDSNYSGELSDDSILNFSIVKNSLGNNGIPSKRVTVNYDSLQSVQTDFVGVVSEEDRQRLSTKYRKVILDATIDCEVSTELSVDSCLNNRQDALYLCSKILNLASKKMSVYSITVESSTDVKLNSKLLLNLPIYNINEVILVYSKEYDTKRGRITIGGIQCLNQQ